MYADHMPPIRDAMRADYEIAPITVACEPIQRDLLLERAFELFPDQKAIFVAEIGEATIYEREIK